MKNKRLRFIFSEFLASLKNQRVEYEVTQKLWLDNTEG